MRMSPALCATMNGEGEQVLYSLQTICASVIVRDPATITTATLQTGNWGLRDIGDFLRADHLASGWLSFY